MVVIKVAFLLYFLDFTLGEPNIVTKNVNQHVDRRTLPEIREGEPCVPGRMYKMDCNTCSCSSDNALICTKMGCLDTKAVAKMREGQKALRYAAQKKEEVKTTLLPKAKKRTVCKPGKFYRSKCKRCFCTNEHKIVCSLKEEACKLDAFANPLPVRTPEDIHPPIDKKEFPHLPQLFRGSDRCEPGVRYKVHCNFCVCTETSDLLCQNKYCISYSEMNRVLAKEMSRKPCIDDPIEKDCVTCKCVNSHTHCSGIPHCRLAFDDSVQEELDPALDKLQCFPNTVYRADCNKCYCQTDGTLRCHQKACLNYSQVKSLEEHRRYLEKHGL